MSMKIHHVIFLSLSLLSSVSSLQAMYGQYATVSAIRNSVGQMAVRGRFPSYSSVTQVPFIPGHCYSCSRDVSDVVRPYTELEQATRFGQFVSKKIDDYCFSIPANQGWKSLAYQLLPSCLQCVNTSLPVSPDESMNTLDSLENIIKQHLGDRKLNYQTIELIRRHNPYFNEVINRTIASKTNWEDLKGSTVDSMFGWNKEGIKHDSIALYIHQMVIQAFRNEFTIEGSTTRAVFSIALKNILADENRYQELKQLIASPALTKTTELKDFRKTLELIYGLMQSYFGRLRLANTPEWQKMEAEWKKMMTVKKRS